MNTMTAVEMMLSVILFFFKAATIPRRMPNGTEKITDQKLTEIDVGKNWPIMTIALTFG